MALTSFSKDQVQALRTLRSLWAPERFVLIGASALSCLMGTKWRQTYDLDLCLAMSTTEYETSMDRLPGWRRDARHEQRWIAPGNVSIDVVPAAPELLAEREFVWPRSNFRMNLTGLRLAFDFHVIFGFEHDLDVAVATVPVITVLKMVAYQDRPPEREKDLKDLCFMMEGFVSDSDERRFSEEAFDSGLSYEEISAFFLGKDVGAIIDEHERSAVVAFLSTAQSEKDPNATQARMIQLGPPSWKGNPRVLLTRLAAFDRGLHM